MFVVQKCMTILELFVHLAKLCESLLELLDFHQMYVVGVFQLDNLNLEIGKLTELIFFCTLLKKVLTKSQNYPLLKFCRSAR